MSGQLEPSRSRPPVLRKAVAGLVLAGVVALVLYFAVHLIIAVFVTFVVVAVIVAVLWALKTIIW